MGVRVFVRGLLLPLPIQSRQIRARDPRGRRETRQKRLVALAGVPADDAAHRRVRLERRGVNRDGLTRQPAGLDESLLHPRKDGPVRLQIDQAPRARNRRMIGRRLVHGQPQKAADRQRVRARTPFSEVPWKELGRPNGRVTHTGRSDWPGLRERLADAWARLPPSVVGLAHRDLYDKQFIQQVNHLAVLDFDLMSRADVTLDPANFLAHLTLRNLQDLPGATQRSIDAGGRKFLQGLERNEEPGFWERLRFYQATTFCRLALVYTVYPGWESLVPDLVTMGNRCLDDLNRIQDR